MALFQPRSEPVAVEEELQGAADDEAVIAHRRHDEHFVDRQALGQEPIEPDIGEDAAGETEPAHAVPLEEPLHRQGDAPFEQRLDRRGGVLAGVGEGERTEAVAQRAVVGQVHLDPAVRGDREVALHLGQEGRLAIGGKPGQLALVAVHPEAQGLGHKPVGEAEAARGMGARQPAIVAVEVGQRAVLKEVVAVIDLIAAAVGGVEQRLLPIGEEEARQRVGKMVVREEDSRVGPQPEIGEEGGGVEHFAGAAPQFADDDIHLAGLFAAGDAAQPLTQLFVRPPMGEIAPAKEPARAHHDFDVRALDAGDAQHLGERVFGKPARALDPVHPLFGDRGEDAVVVEQRGRGIVRSRMQAEDQHGGTINRHPGAGRDPFFNRSGRGSVGPGLPHGSSPWAKGPRDDNSGGCGISPRAAPLCAR